MTTLLLSILETKEKIRNERFAEIARLLDELRLVSALRTFEVGRVADVVPDRTKTASRDEVCVLSLALHLMRRIDVVLKVDLSAPSDLAFPNPRIRAERARDTLAVRKHHLSGDRASISQGSSPMLRLQASSYGMSAHDPPTTSHPRSASLAQGSCYLC